VVVVDEFEARSQLRVEEFSYGILA